MTDNNYCTKGWRGNVIYTDECINFNNMQSHFFSVAYFTAKVKYLQTEESDPVI